eukprot:699303-Prorocentrum_minimum.AAC.3
MPCPVIRSPSNRRLTFEPDWRTGTGKTLIARQLARALNAPAPKVVNGPDIFQRFVGQSEENIRELFAPAEKDSMKFGVNSPLHVIIFDEIDAVMKVPHHQG